MSKLRATETVPLPGPFAAADSPPPQLIWNPSETDLADPKLRFLLAYWNGMASPTGTPPAAGIDALALRPILGLVMLLEPVDGGRDFRYRVYGSMIARRSGLELTGKLTSDLPSRAMATYFIATYRAVARTGLPLYARHATPHRIQTPQWDRLILAFAGDNGRVARLLVGNIPGSRTL